MLPVPTTGPAAAGGGQEALQWVHRLQERTARCEDYQYLVRSYEKKGTREEERTYRLYVKDCRLVRIKVTGGRGKGSEAALDAQGRIHGRKGGLLKAFPKTLRPEDSRIRSLRGTAFWEAACHNFLKDLRERMAQPGARCEIGPDRDQSGRLLMVVDRPGGAHEKYWIDPQQMRLMKGEVYEDHQLVKRFTIEQVRENVGLTESFFSF